MSNLIALKHDVFPASHWHVPSTTSRVSVFTLGLVLGWALLFPSQTMAKQSQGHVNVGVAVQPYAHSTSVQPTQLVIGNDDLANGRGYVDVPSKNNPTGVNLTVRTNDRAGYTLVFSVSPEMQVLISAVQIAGLSVPVALPPSGGEVVVPYGGNNVSATLSVRFVLLSKNTANAKKNTLAGTYAWPLLISARPN